MRLRHAPTFESGHGRSLVSPPVHPALAEVAQASGVLREDATGSRLATTPLLLGGFAGCENMSAFMGFS